MSKIEIEYHKEDERFARVAWSIDDIHGHMHDCEHLHPHMLSDAGVQFFFNRFASTIQERMTQVGWDTIDTLLIDYLNNVCRTYLVRAEKQYNGNRVVGFYVASIPPNIHPDKIIDVALDILPYALDVTDEEQPRVNWMVELESPDKLDELVLYEWLEKGNPADLTPQEITRLVDVVDEEE